MRLPDRVTAWLLLLPALVLLVTFTHGPALAPLVILNEVKDLIVSPAEILRLRLRMTAIASG